jgi:hypothetical protein
MRQTSAGGGSGSAAPFVLWGAIGLSILVEFGVLLALQRARIVRIDDAGGVLPAWAHVALAAVLFVAGAVLVARLRVGTGRTRAGNRTRPNTARGAARLDAARDAGPSARADADPMRGRVGRAPETVPGSGAAPAAISPREVASWAVGEGLALVGFVLAAALQPLPRLAIIIYFTGGLFLWLRSRPRAGRPPDVAGP